MFAERFSEKVSLARTLSSLLALTLSSFAATALAAASPHELSGQWIGGSLLDGQRETAKTTLDLGADDEGTTLRIENRSNCTLKRGNYAPLQGEETSAWSLSFKAAQGGESCERLAQGKFVLRAGATPRTIQFDVVYPSSDGSPNHRHGTLTRYP